MATRAAEAQRAATQGPSAAMLISGLAVLRNTVRLDYPFLESIRSALPICDEFVVVVGASDDGTLEQVRALEDPRIRVIETEWSDLVTPRHCLIAQQTNLGMHSCRGIWCLYLQANEVLHESSLPVLRAAMEYHANDSGVEAMLVERLTFWGDYEHVLRCYPDRFKYTPRVLRPHSGTYSVRDGMGVAVFPGFATRGRPPRSIDTGQDVYRYGFVRSGADFGRKSRVAVHMQDWGDLTDAFLLERYPAQMVSRYRGTHPAVMAQRVAATGERYLDDDPRCRRTMTLGERKRLLETRLYERFGLPRWRDKRYSLVGDFQEKDRASPGRPLSPVRGTGS